MNPDNLLQVLEPLTPSSGNDPLLVDYEPNLYNLSDYVDIPMLIESLNLACSSPSVTKLNILSLNSESLNAKFSQISYLVDTLESENCRLHVICLQESWLTASHDTSLLQLQNYHFIHQPKSCSEHGGVCMYIHDSIKFKIHEPKLFTTWENQTIELHPTFSSKSILISNVYRPPNAKNFTELQAIVQFNEEFLNYYSNFPKNFYIKYLVGDFNLDILKTNVNENICTYLDNLISEGFIPQITLPTRYSIQHGSSSLIDNIFAKSNHSTTNFTAKILTHKISDHFGCCLSTELPSKSKLKKSAPTLVEIFPNYSENIEIFRTTFSNLNLMQEIDLTINADPSENYNIVEQAIIRTQSEIFVSKRVKFNKYKHKKNAWITFGIINSIQFRDDLYKRLRLCTPGSIEWSGLKINLKTYNSILKKSIRAAKEVFFANSFEKVKGDMKKTWKCINEVLNRGKKKNDFPDCFNIDNSLVSDPKVIADAFNDFFVNIGPRLAESTNNSDVDLTFESYLKNPTTSSFDFSPINNTDILTTIESLKSKKSCGYDNFSTELLRAVKLEISPILAALINQSFTSGIFPDKLKIAKVSPIYKKSDSSKIDNYRPISLLPSISKVFEKLIHSQILNYFNENNLFFKSQYGFRPKHSTEFATLELVDRLMKSMNSGDIPLSIFIDLSKAFDTLNHKILLTKLNYYGLSKKSLNLLCNYLHNRTQYVTFNGVESSYKKISTGVPQGSILGPLLFLIYINDIEHTSDFFSIISYADDTTLTCDINCKLENISTKINTELAKIHTWLTLNKLSLNILKTNFILFSQRNKVLPKIELELNGIALEQVNVFNFLGTTLDSNLSWKPHINKIACKISKVVGILSRLMSFIPNSVLLNIYNALIVPHLNYSILNWGFANTKRILILQKKAIRKITGSAFKDHSAILFKSLNLLRIDDLFLSALLKFYFKVENKSLPNYFNDFSTSRLSHTHHTRFKRHILPPMSKNYTRACVRFGLIKLLNFTHEPSSSIDANIYITKSQYDKLSSKPRNLITDIINKLHTHSFSGFAFYIKTRFIQNYNTYLDVSQ